RCVPARVKVAVRPPAIPMGGVPDGNQDPFEPIGYRERCGHVARWFRIVLASGDSSPPADARGPDGTHRASNQARPDVSYCVRVVSGGCASNETAQVQSD